MKRDGKIDRSHKFMLLIFFMVLIWSAIKPYSFLTWILEALPAIIMVLVLALTYKRFKFSTFVYLVVLIQTIILLIGSKYTYERNPFFDYLMQRLDLNRNYFDRVGHFAQGFTPAVMAKELLLRKGYLKRSKMFYYIVISIVLAVSAAYELLEFVASRISGVPGYMVLSYQGDEWDTQWDMVMALLGAVTALMVFGKTHDKSIDILDD
ncbi:DUF2238 domain-containing protein [Tissierella creatinophila]|uniref:Inner membrane protein YjdF n=1 Tax=Tissierella creatinophila DSM 6911 TaxID=1123403 RepID=A0A1U7M718_TISCR|nr:DUF2238 domain-containing protein [Tissierella creatinophila]OLS03075.1 inner membrane protein YjdF [Tissierella creatinophila DSM 6911]